MSPSAPKLGYCRICGKALDETNLVNAQGTIYCKEHAPMSTTTAGFNPETPNPGFTGGPQSPYTAPPPYPGSGSPPVMHPEVSPGLAFLLGWIPGVGAIYNGQYGKGLVHVVIIGLMISVLDSHTASGLEPLIGLMLSAFWFYMCFEAFHTARRRRMGLPVDEFSSLIPLKGGSALPIIPVGMIGFGVLLLLANLDLLDFRKVFRYWPVLLIGLGIYMLYVRYSSGDGAPKE
jgi:Domain of unknown function (DUF5668)